MEWLLASALIPMAGTALWMAYKATAEADERAETALLLAAARSERDTVIRERDSAVASLAQRTDELGRATTRLETLNVALVMCRRELNEALKQKVAAASDDDLPAAIDSVLASKAVSASSTTTGGASPAAANAVPGSRPKAPVA